MEMENLKSDLFYFRCKNAHNSIIEIDNENFDENMVPLNKSKWKIAVVCEHNLCPSVLIQKVLREKGFFICSYGAAPAIFIKSHVEYSYEQTYHQIKYNLEQQEKEFYTTTGTIGILEYNSRIKPAPHYFDYAQIKFDIIITFNKKVMERVVDRIEHDRFISQKKQSVHIINIDVQPNMKSASLGAKIVNDLLHTLCKARDLDKEIVYLLRKDFQQRRQINMWYCPRVY